MRLELFEKSEILGPTIYMNVEKICFASGILEFYENFTFQKISKLNFEIRDYISHISIIIFTYYITLFIY